MAVSYRRVRSFSSAFITIQSSSPATSMVELFRLQLPLCRNRRQRFAGTQPRAGLGRFFFADDPEHLVEGPGVETLAVERDLSGQEFIEEDAQRVDVGASVDVEAG